MRPILQKNCGWRPKELYASLVYNVHERTSGMGGGVDSVHAHERALPWQHLEVSQLQRHRVPRDHLRSVSVAQGTFSTWLKC